jgi:hypothetical protein
MKTLPNGWPEPKFWLGETVIVSRYNLNAPQLVVGIHHRPETNTYRYITAMFRNLEDWEMSLAIEGVDCGE